MKAQRHRQAVLFAALAASLGAALWVHGQDSDASDSIAAPVEHGNSRSAAAPEADNKEERLALERLNRRTPGGTEVDPFRTKTWYVPPPPPPPQPPPKPTAPPLPFKYMGSFEEPSSGKLIVYLSRGDESFPVSPGDKFDDDKYQFDGIERGRIAITYLPLSIKQNLILDVQ